MRDITLGDTIYIRFTTRAFATGIPTVLAGSPVLSVYEENNLTQITSGVSVTVDYDSVVGLNQATIVATSGNTYENGKSYDLVITTGTVGGVSVVGEVVGQFTIGSSAAAVDLANATDGLSALKTLIDAIPTTAMRGTDGALTDKAGFSLSAAGIDAIHDEVMEGTLTFRNIVRILLAEAAGIASGGNTVNVKFRDNADSKDRIDAIVDTDGNRSAVTLDGS